jgi:hypothetical protein
VKAVEAEPTAPQAARTIASDVLSRIRRLTIGDIPSAVAAEPLTRIIGEVIIHHTGQPGASDYKGYDTIYKIGTYQIHERGWKRLGWHYAVAPDGAVWLGMPLDERPANLVKRNTDTASILLILDGDRDLQTDAQLRSLGVLLQSLFVRLNLSPNVNFAAGHGFHRDYDTKLTCPGSRITKEIIAQSVPKPIAR